MPKRKSQAKQSKAAKARPPRGQVGPQTYEAVLRVVQEKKIPLIRAFEEVAKATGRKAGTIAFTYYRILRKKRGGAPGRRGRGPARQMSGSSSDGAKSILSRVSASIRQLQSIIAQQEREIERLRGESQLADRIRKAMRE